MIGVRELEGSNEGHDAMPLKHAVTWLAVLAGRPRSQVFFFQLSSDDWILSRGNLTQTSVQLQRIS